MKIALISEHASPLATLGGVDSGGQNVYVANIARQLARAGHRVDVFTRRDDEALPGIVQFDRGVRVLHIPAGPRRHVPKEELLPHIREFALRTLDYCAAPVRRYDIVHANFFMSGIVAARLKEVLNIPFVITFHALGKVRQRHQKDADRFPAARTAIEERLVGLADRIVAECPQDREDLLSLYGADPDKIDVVGCGVDTRELSTSGRSARVALGLREDEFVVLQLGRLVPRKGVDNVIRAVACLERLHGIRARLLVVGVGANLSIPIRSSRPRSAGLPPSPSMKACANASRSSASVRATCCVTITPPRTCSSPRRGTSLSASRRWRPWPAARR